MQVFFNANAWDPSKSWHIRGASVRFEKSKREHESDPPACTRQMRTLP